MTTEQIIRTWIDPSFRARLGASAPSHPAGLTELNDEALSGFPGGEGEQRSPAEEEECALTEEEAGPFTTLFGSRRQTCCPIW